MESFIERNICVLKKMELTSNEAVKQALLAGLGCSIMPLIGIRSELQNNELNPIKGLPIKTTWSLIWLKAKAFSCFPRYYLKRKPNYSRQI
jgi:DNA-binding transcriptional LysR family regulator